MQQLSKKLTTFGLTMIAIGSCIGSGIFLTPSMIAGHLGDAWMILGVWALGGVIALAGALSLAYLGIIFPQTGGVYVYLRERYGSWAAFSYGWIILTVVTSGAIAALSMAFARYVDFIIPLGPKGVLVLAIVGIIVVTFVNLRGVDKADLMSTFFTILKLLGIVMVILIGVYHTMDATVVERSANDAGQGTHLWKAMAGAMIGIIWSYGGWHHASYVAGEAVQPERSVPRAMIYGTIVVTVTYVIVNWAYLKLLGPQGMASSSAVASDAVSVVYQNGAKMIAILIAVSTFGTMGIYTLSAPRIYYAMAKDEVFFPQLAQLHQKYQTPVFAIILQSLWAIILVLFWGTFENLITYVVFMDWVFMAMAVGAVFHFYKRRVEKSIKYKIPLYPITPIFYVLVAVVFLVRILMDNPMQAWAGIVLLLAGVPFYYFFSRKSSGD